VGGLYLCDSDSDVTVSITMVEHFKLVEDLERGERTQWLELACYMCESSHMSLFFSKV
jgi:hypothetical protein